MNDSTVPLEVSASEAHRQLSNLGHPAQLLDVREAWEVQLSRVENALFIPMAQVPGNLARLPRDRALLLLCHHGTRSLRVTHFLRANGFPLATNIAGGIEAWAQEVNSTLPRY